MARKILLMLFVLGAGVGFAWYWRGSQPEGVEPSSVVPAEAEAPTIVIANASAPSAPAASELSEPSLVGLPFELSASVRANCRKWEGDCRELDAFLDRMQAEPRNAEWARAMEARIEKAVKAGERGKFRIRALECRSTRCALEVASEVASIGVQFDSDPALDELMFERPGYHADENDPQTGITTLVTAQTWQTTESLEAEEDASE